MRIPQLLIVLIIVYGILVPANASLINMGGGRIYDDDRNLTWLQDANYAKTSGYDTDGIMTWSEANNWITYLNNIKYLSYSDWRLPHGDSSCGWAYNCIDSDMGHLYYTELGNSDASSLANRGPFINLWENVYDPYIYWTDTTYPLDSNFAWIFLFNYGQQGVGGKSSVEYAVWPVRDGGGIPPNPGALNITSFSPITSTVTNNVDESRTFSITTNQTVNVSWFINRTEVFNETDVIISSYTNSSAALGTWNVTAVASNNNGSDIQTWTWVVQPIMVQGAPEITSFTPASPVNDIVGATRTFTVNVNQTTNITWYINETEVFNQSSVTQSSYTKTSAALGAWNVIAIVVNENGSGKQTWVWTVTPVPTAGGSILANKAVAYQINPAHGGFIQTELLPPLRKRWEVNLGSSISYPLIANGKIFVTVANTGTYGTKLYALDAETGKSVWDPISINGTYFWSNAAYENGTIFVVNFDGLLSAYNAENGTLIWSQKLLGQYAFSSPPTATGGIVYTGGAGSGGTVYAVNTTNGTILWTASVMNGDHSSPAVSYDGIYVSYACGQTYKFNPLNGSLLWHYSTSCEGGGGKTPVYHNERLYGRDFVTTPPGYVLDSKTGDLIERYNAGPAPAFDGNLGVFLNGSILEDRNLTTGNILWTFTGDGSLSSAPIIVNKYVYIGSTSGNLYVLDVISGSLVWNTSLGSSIPSPDEQNVAQPLTGLGAGEGLLVVPAGNLLITYEMVPVLKSIAFSPSTVTLTVGGTQQFNATALDQTNKPIAGVNISWTVSNSTLGGITPLFAVTGSDGNASATFNALAVGTAMVNATNGTISGNASIIVNSVPSIGAPDIIDFSPPTSTVTNNVSESRTFSIATNQTVNVSWLINGTEVFNETGGVTEALYTNNSAAVGTWNVTAVTTNVNGTAMQTWFWIVTVVPTAGGSISGFKINDTNSNGKWDVGEKGISNWTIRLIGITGKGKNAKVIREETFTDTMGFYKFDNLSAGRYFVIEKLKKGFVPTSSPVKRIKLAHDENSMNNNFTNRPVHSQDKTDSQRDVNDYEVVNRNIDRYKEEMD